MSTYRAAIITNNDQIKQPLKEQLENKGMDVDAGGTAIDESSFYHFLFVGEDVFDRQSPNMFQRASVCIGLLQERSFENVRNWMKQGAEDVVLIPDEWDRLDELIEYGLEKIERATTISSGSSIGGEVLAFYSAKGGSGKTLLAAMLSQCLKTQYDKKVLFLDLNAQFGGAEGLMALEPVRNYSDLLPVLNELSIHHVHNVTTEQEQTELEVLSGPSHPEKAEEVTEELVQKLIRLCKEHYDYVIVDVPSFFQTITYTALTEATKIYYPLTPDTMAIRTFKQTKALLDRLQLTSKDKFQLIINKTETKNEITEKDIKNIVGIEAVGKVRADFYGIQPFINMGLPFYTKKGKVNQTKPTADINRFVQKNLVKMKGK
ncbi:pilus assembly protein CpaE [Alteribacillus persepolensis]|uniref:Pilus assembly protein CpaE n=1 Tax=Alteribacillus persepolensis TaxID=568899 RepID=A0A1G8EXU7_9BACI|nr:AAA family ATPase [Alteribacillus persepolensis]SDH74690.1 pilus assembly protein CpaE [Alteribacillus persepolensis]